MADNIKIVGEILNTQQVSRYDTADINLLSPQTLKEDFGQQNDYIEYFVYDAGGNLLNINYNYKDFKSPNTSFVNPDTNALPIIEIDPVMDLQNLGYSSGEFIVQYNLFNNRVSNPSAELFLKEISADRTELRVGSTILTNQQIEDATLSLINEATGSSYFVDHLLNFGNNIQAIAVNVALNKAESGYEILFKLYHPLPDNIQEKATLWVVNEKANPYLFDINLDKLIIPAPGPQLRGPNFAIDIPNQNNIGTSYQTYSGLINNFQNASVSSSYQQLLSLITSQSIDINVNYTNFTNFVFFSSAKQRLTNFYNKVKEIEDYKNLINVYSPLTSSRPNLINDINVATSSINNNIANFDGYEYYLYFESSSYAWPKTTSTLPYTLASTGSVTSWYNSLTSSADTYDDSNPNNLIYTVPSFIKDDGNNDQYITFLNMVGHYFDNIWIYLQAVTDINLANNNLEQGVSKDLVYHVLQSLGTKLYNKYGDSSNDIFLVGQNSGSVNFDNNFTPTGSYLNNIPHKDLLAETYKRIYHNLPLLLKTRGTTYGLQTLVSTFGITSSILNIKEYGGDLKSNMLDEYNNDKIRIISSSIYSGNVLSPYVSLQAIPTSSTLFRTNDTHYVDISFSPETQIDTYASAAIAIANPTWSLDDYIGDPRQLYSGSYNDLNTQKNTYYTFTASRMDYAGFIRLIQFFDNSLFKMLKDYVPARANLSTGITISSPVLERNKWVYSNPSSTSKLTTYDVNLSGSVIKPLYDNIYNYITGSKAAYYTGEFSGSTIKYGDDWINRNFNPYLHPTASLTSSINAFNHSTFNVLLNNVSASRLSNTRKDIQYIFGTTGSILSPAYLQDSNESLITYNRARYDGVKVSSLLYNTYTSASTGYDGDLSYGKTAAIDRNSRKLGLFTNIISSSFLPNRNKVALKYLVDEYGNLTELNQRNKHWEDIQRTFVADDYLNISQFDNQKFSNQKTTDGDKLIFDSGYSYYPILYFPGTCDGNQKIYFNNLGIANSYTLNAINGLNPKNISGSTDTTINYPIKSGNIYNIFDTVVEGSLYYTPGTATTFPSYSVQEAGDHKASANVTLYVTMSNGGTQAWELSLYKNTSLITSDTFNVNLNISLAATSSTSTNWSFPYPRVFINSGSCSASPSFTVYGTFVGNAPADILINGGPSKININTPIFEYYVGKDKFFDTYECTVSDYIYVYSTNSSLEFFAWSETCPLCSPGLTPIFYRSGDLYDIPGFTTNLSGTTSYTFNITANPISGLAVGDKIVPKLKLTSTSTNNFTASVSEGNLLVGSLSVSTGYAYTNCAYFDSASISKSVADNNKNTITFSSGLSGFYNKNYQFVPNPLTGSQNSLYDVYGDVDYPFYIKPYDIALTYLSDNTYIESRILNITTSGSYVQLTVDNQMSKLQIANLESSSFQRFLILSRQQDETSAYITFPKRPGDTSYGFIIPQDIAPSVLGNIDIITKEVKQKLLTDQSGITINTY